MAERLNPQPPNWGRDELSAFMDAARSNTFASFQLYRGVYLRLAAIDAVYLRLLTDFVDPEGALGATFALRCHSALRAAAQLALAGQVPESFAIVRSALEHALYAHHASTSAERTQIWMRRRDDGDDGKQCAREFTPREIFPLLRQHDKQVGDVAGVLYDRTIDYGAHPNSHGTLTSMTIDETDDADTFSFAYLTGAELPIRFALRSWCQTAICSLDIFALVLPERFRSLELHEQLLPLRDGL